MAKKKILIKTIPFSGGVDLFHEPVTLLDGEFSQIKNFRPRDPGFESRLGQTKHHTANTDNTNAIASGYSFSKGRITERALFAQYSNGEVRKAADNPPATTTGEFGTQVLATISGASPAAWATYRDYLMYADGARQAQIYTGTQQVPVLVNVYKGTTMPDVPTEGANFLDEATDGLSTTVVVLDSLNTLANNDGFFIGFDTPVNKITLTVSAANGNASVATVHYRKNDSTWADTSDTDGTTSGGASLAQTGSFTWTLPSDEVPHYAFGKSCFLYRITFSVALDSEVEISAVTGESTEGFQDVQNIWDGAMPDAVQTLTYDASAGVYYKYSGEIIKMTDFVWAGGANDYLYFASQDRLFGAFLDVGKTPNTTGSSSVNEVATWTEAGWAAVTGLEDGTSGGANSGHLTWVRNDNARKTMFKGDVEAYWYRVRFNNNVAGANTMTWAITTMPYFENIYPLCQTIGTWDKRVWTSYDDNHFYGAAVGFPMSVNGDDVVKLIIGDFRSNKIIAQRRFYNFMLIWQAEKGEEGGGFHIIEPGDTAAGYASQVISDEYGIMNNKCAVVLEDVGMVDLSGINPIMKGVYFLSRNGVIKTDGSFLTNVSGKIANYFDASRPESIRAGYEEGHFLVKDSLYKGLRLGLVTGDSATKPNVFFFYNYADNEWFEDDLGQGLSSMFEVEAASGNVPVLQYGGSQDGYVMHLNNTDDDISTAIDKSVKIELDGEGWQIRLKGLVVVVKDQTAGDLIVDVYRKGEAASALTETLTMINSSAGYKGHRFECDVLGDHLTIRLRNATVGQPVYLLKYGVDVEKSENHVAYD